MSVLTRVKMVKSQFKPKQGLKIARKSLIGLGAGIVTLVASPESVKAATLAYGYAYQEIRDFNITGLSDVMGLTLEPATTSRAALNTSIMNGDTTNALDVGQAISARPSQVGLGNNSGFFIPNLASYFNTQYRFQSGVADFSRADAIIGFDNSGTLSPVADAATLTNTILNGGANNGLVWGAVAESFIDSPGSQILAGGFRQDEGNAAGTFSLTSTDFNVASSRTVSFDFDYLNASDFQLTDPTPLGAPNENLADFQLAFVITINEVNGIGDIVATLYQSTNTDSNGLNGILNFNTEADPSVDTQSFPFGDNNVGIEGFVGATGEVIGIDNPDPSPSDFSTTLAPLTNGNLYRLTIRSEQIVNTRVLSAPEIPEPSAAISLIGLGLFGLIRKLQ